MASEKYISIFGYGVVDALVRHVWLAGEDAE